MHDNVIGRHNNIHVYGKFYTYFDTYFFFYVLCITFVRLIKDEKKKNIIFSIYSFYFNLYFHANANRYLSFNFYFVRICLFACIRKI